MHHSIGISKKALSVVVDSVITENKLRTEEATRMSERNETCVFCKATEKQKGSIFKRCGACHVVHYCRFVYWELRKFQY